MAWIIIGLFIAWIVVVFIMHELSELHDLQLVSIIHLWVDQSTNVGGASYGEIWWGYPHYLDSDLCAFMSFKDCQ